MFFQELSLRPNKNLVNEATCDEMVSLQLAAMMLPEEEKFLLLFHRETPLDDSVEFMRVRSKVNKQ